MFSSIEASSRNEICYGRSLANASNQPDHAAQALSKVPAQSRTVRTSPAVRFFGSWLHHHNLWHLHRRSVAGGLAVGLFAGMIPGPLQMLTAAILAMVLRVNLPVAVLATWFTNPVTIVPLYIVAYKLGVLLLGTDGAASPDLSFELTNKGIADWLPALLAWLTTLGKPFVVGLLLLAVLLAAAGYVFVIVGWRLYVAVAWRRRAAARACQRRDR